MPDNELECSFNSYPPPPVMGEDTVWIICLNQYGWRVQQNAFASVVNYVLNGKLYRETFENEELLEWGDYVNDYSVE